MFFLVDTFLFPWNTSWFSPSVPLLTLFFSSSWNAAPSPTWFFALTLPSIQGLKPSFGTQLQDYTFSMMCGCITTLPESETMYSDISTALCVLRYSPYLFLHWIIVMIIFPLSLLETDLFICESVYIYLLLKYHLKELAMVFCTHFILSIITYVLTIVFSIFNNFNIKV